MARIQYRPSAQGKGFNPNKLSTEGISRMREESSRIVQGLKETRQAEAKQAAINLRAMESDAAYTERITKENNAIEQQNLQNRQNQILADIQGEQKQAQTDSAAAQTIVDSLVDFSDTLGKEAARRTQQMIEDQTEIGKLSVQALDPQRLEEYIRAENARVDGTIMMTGEITANDAESNADRLETIKSLVGIPGMSGYAAQAAMNELSQQLYGDTLQSRLIDSETTYTSSNGTTYTGLQASRDVNLSNDLQRQTERDVLKFLNITEPLQIRKGLAGIRKYNDAINTQTRSRNLEDKEEELRQQVAASYRTNTFEGFTQGFHVTRGAFGLKEAHDSLQELVADPSIDLDQLKKVKIDGKVWYENWANRWEDGLAERNKAISNGLRLERQLTEEEDKAWVRNSLPSIQEAYNQNAHQASLLVRKRYLDKGMSVPQAIKNIETAAFAKNKAEVQATFEERKNFGILDLSFVNSIQDPTLQKKAKAAFEDQQLSRYGPETLGIKKGLKASARKLTKIDPNEEQGSATTFLVQARLESEYLKELKTTNDPLKALENVNRMVDAANSGDKSSPFFSQSGQNNRLIFPNIQSSDREKQERNTYIDKKLISDGVGIVDLPYTLATQNEMNAAYQSSLYGVMQYPTGVLRVADQFGLKPSEVYNAQRAANNLTSGVNKPLLTPSPVNQLIDSAPKWMQKLFRSKEDSQVNRGVATATGNLPRRANMGGDIIRQRSALQEVAAELGVNPIDLATIIGFETGGTYDPGQPGGEGGNYRGLIQFGGPERDAYGVTPGMTFEEQLRGPVVNFFKDRFAKAGMSTQGASLEDLYTTVLAGNPGANRDAKDSFGTSARAATDPTTEKGKIMAAHREAAIKRFGF